MYQAAQLYVTWISHLNRVVGVFAMYLVLVMMAVLLYASYAKISSTSPIWVVEMAQFLMVAYYLLGGGYSMQLDAHVRMDVLYSKWAAHKQALVDSVTVLCLIVYLIMLLYGSVSSTLYSLEYNQKNYSAWAPPIAPIKIIMSIGILLMLLQVIATLLQNIASAFGRPFKVPAVPEDTA